MTIKITLPLLEAIEACAAVLPHVSKDRITPVITTASITGNTITATDRYTVGQFKLSVDIGDSEVLLPLEAVTWIARFVTKQLLDYDSGLIWQDPDNERGAKVIIEAPERHDIPNDRSEERTTLTIQVTGTRGVEQQRTFYNTAGNFPPVGRLIADHAAAEQAVPTQLKPEFIEKFTGYAKKWHRNSPIRVTFGKTDNPAKPGPALITVGKFAGLLQPNLLLR